MATSGETAPDLHVRTPCIGSVALSQKTGCRVYLKLENTQPSGSFKIRGIGKILSENINNFKQRLKINWKVVDNDNEKSVRRPLGQGRR